MILELHEAGVKGSKKPVRYRFARIGVAIWNRQDNVA
jgi:hypothetical protein